MRKRPKLRKGEVGGAYYYYLIFVMHYSWEKTGEMFKVSEQWQIEEIAYKGLARRKVDRAAWQTMTERIEI